MLTLALGIGATTAIFSVLYSVLIKPLPYPHADELVRIRHPAPGINFADLSTDPTMYLTLVMLAIAGAMALVLGVIGIYGLIPYVVLQRTREIGIRSALGAEPRQLKRMFLCCTGSRSVAQGSLWGS